MIPLTTQLVACASYWKIFSIQFTYIKTFFYLLINAASAWTGTTLILSTLKCTMHRTLCWYMMGNPICSTISDFDMFYWALLDHFWCYIHRYYTSIIFGKIFQILLTTYVSYRYLYLVKTYPYYKLKCY